LVPIMYILGLLKIYNSKMFKNYKENIKLHEECHHHFFTLY